MKECQHCAEGIKDDVLICPHCGNRQATGVQYNIAMIALAVILILALIFTILYFQGGII